MKYLHFPSSRSLTFSDVKCHLSSSIFIIPLNDVKHVFNSLVLLHPHFVIALLLFFQSVLFFFSLLKKIGVRISLYSCTDKVMIPCCSKSPFFVNVGFIISSHFSDDVIQLRNLIFLFWFECLYVNVSALSKLHTEHVEDLLRTNSFISPCHIIFLEVVWNLVVSLSTSRNIHFCKLLNVLLICTYQSLLLIETSCDVDGCCEIRFATMTHISQQFQVRRIPRPGFLNGEDDKRVRTCKSQQFVLYERNVERPIAINVD